MIFGIAELVVISLVLLSISIILFLVFRKGQREPSENQRGRRLGMGIGIVILLGIGVGLYKLANPPFDRMGAIGIPSVTKVSKNDGNPEDVILQLQSYRKALIVDIWSIRLVFPDRYWFGYFSELHHRTTTGNNAWSMTRSIQGTVVSLDWPYSPQNTSGESPGVLGVLVDGALITIENGIATIGDFQVPATGTLSVVFFDQFGKIENVMEKLEGDDSGGKK